MISEENEMEMEDLDSIEYKSLEQDRLRDSLI